MEKRICIFCKKPFDVNDSYFETEEERHRKKQESLYGYPRYELPWLKIRAVCPNCLIGRKMSIEAEMKVGGDINMARLNFGKDARFPWAKKIEG